MILNLDDYRHVVKPQVAKWLEDRKEYPIIDQIGPLALYTSCHIVGICYYIGEVSGFTPELLSKIDRYSQYYLIDEVLGQEKENWDKELSQ